MKKIAITIIKFIGFFLGWAILTSILPLSSSENPAIWRLWAEIMPLLAIIFFTLIFWLVEKKNMKLHLFDNPIKGTALGVITGVVWLAIPVLIMYIAKIINLGVSRIFKCNYAGTSCPWLSVPNAQAKA